MQQKVVFIKFQGIRVQFAMFVHTKMIPDFMLRDRLHFVSGRFKSPMLRKKK